MPRDYPESVAGDFPACLDIVKVRVKPERDRLTKGDATARDRARRWWQFARPTIELYSTIADLDRVIVVAATSRTLAFAMAPTSFVFSHATYVIAFEDIMAFGVLQSAIHEAWAREHASSMKGDLRYTPTDCLETFPFVKSTSEARAAAQRYLEGRTRYGAEHSIGLTRLYGRLHDSSDRSSDTIRLRDAQVEMDKAVLAAYGWDDLDLAHDFRETKQGRRFAVSETARREILDRLLDLNHERYREEVARGLHGKAASKTNTVTTPRRKAKSKASPLLEGV